MKRNIFASVISFRRPFVFERLIVFDFARHTISSWGEGIGDYIPWFGAINASEDFFYLRLFLCGRATGGICTWLLVCRKGGTLELHDPCVLVFVLELADYWKISAFCSVDLKKKKIFVRFVGVVFKVRTSTMLFYIFVKRGVHCNSTLCCDGIEITSGSKTKTRWR